MSLREAWWRVVEDSKYGSYWGGWCFSEPVGAYGVVLWKNVRMGWGKFYNHTKFKVGDGSKVKFWHDLWCGDIALKDAFLVLFGIVHAKDVLVEDHMKFFGVVIQWNVSFARAAQDWELDVFALFYRLYLVRTRREGKDRL
jgi:hypothetical protein